MFLKIVKILVFDFVFFNYNVSVCDEHMMECYNI